MTTKSSGFSLIELLVVVAILGIISAIGIVSYNGYVGASKKKSAENALMQLSLAQTEYYSDNSSYYGASGGSCIPSKTTSDTVETALVSGAELFSKDLGYNVCAVTDVTALYFLIATDGKCTITLTGNTQKFTRTGC